MQKICPTLNSYAEALSFFDRCKKIRFHYIEAKGHNTFGSFVLSTGYKPKKITLSLIQGCDSEQKEGTVLRLVLNEKGCKSIYNIKKYRDFDKILRDITDIAKKNNQNLQIVYLNEQHKNNLKETINSYNIDIRYDFNRVKVINR